MLKTKKAIIFGTGGFAEVVSFLLERDSSYEVVAYTNTQSNPSDSSFCGKPLVAFEKIEEIYSPNEYEIFVAVGYVKMNQTRQHFFNECKNKGYKLLSYVSSKAQYWDDLNIGENVFIFELNNIQPFVKIGDGTIIWSGNHIGHHSVIGSFCFITSHAVISGYCQVGNRSFVGVNSTIIDNVSIAEENLIGAGAMITKNTRVGEVYVAERAKKIDKSSEYFL